MSLGNLAVTPDQKRSEQIRRARSHELDTIEPALLPSRQADGWELQRTFKSGKLRIKRPKKFDEILENSAWMIFHDLGFDELSIGRHFKIGLHSKSGSEIRKQIDVFAKDDQTIFVIECKACETPSPRGLQKDLAEFSENKKHIADAIRKHYGKDFKPKIVWCFFTRNVIWSPQDIARAREARIQIVRDQEILYFSELANTLGAAARYQFHAEFLKNERIPEMAGKKCPAVRSKLGPVSAYSFMISAEDLLSIAFVNHRDLRDPSGVPSYQRMVRPGRLRKIANFLDNGGFFPNSVIVNFRKKVEFEPLHTKDDNSIVAGMLILPDQHKSCWIIDGQHRLYACALMKKQSRKILLPVLAFDRIDPTVEAELFATINKEQVKVSPKLLEEIYGEVKWDSEIRKEQLSAIASRAVDLMRSDVGSPFYQCIQSASMSSDDSLPLTLTEIKKAILSSGIIGLEVGKEKLFSPGVFSAKTNEQTLKRLVDGLNSYFSLIRNANPDRWAAGRSGFLCNNFGVPAYIRLLKKLIAEHEMGTKLYSKSAAQIVKEIEPALTPALSFVRDAEDEQFFERFKVTLGSGGVREYHDKLVALIDETKQSFAA